MTAITSSMLRNTIMRPSKMWMRFSTWPKRCSKRRVTVCTRKSSHSLMISNKFFCAGLPSMPIITKLMDTLISKLVCASKVFINSSLSMRLDLGSNTKRTGQALSDSSRTYSNCDNSNSFWLICSCVSFFLPFLSLGLVCSSISAKIFCAPTPGGNSLTMARHWPRANFSIS